MEITEKILNDEKMLIKFIRHKTINLFVEPDAYHYCLRNHGSSPDMLNNIMGAKELFRSHLSQIIYDCERGKMKLPLVYSLDKFKEAIKKSDFDWTDYNKYKEFREWFFVK